MPPSLSCAEIDCGRRSADYLGEPPQVLCDCCQRELELRATRAAQTQSVKTQDALQVGKQHLNFFAITARSRVGFGLAARPGDLASLFVDVARNFACWSLRAALHFERAYPAVAPAGPIEDLVVVHDRAGGRQHLACWADIDVALVVEREVLPRENAILALRLFDHRDVGSNLLFIDEPV